MKRILVTGAGGSASYNFVKSLRDNPNKEKIYVVGVDTSKYHMELSPLDKRYIVPFYTESGYIDEINKIIKTEKINFIHMQPDGEVNYISENREKIHAKTFLPSDKTIKICQDKMLFNSTLREKGVPVPEAYMINNYSDLKKGLQNLLKYNQKVWLRATKGAGSKASLPINDFEHAKMWIDYWQKMKGIGLGDFMISEFLPGKEYAFQSVWKNGRLIMSQSRERMEYVFGHLMPSGQSSSPSVAKTVNNDEVNKTAYDAVKSVDNNANGIFCVDLKTDKNNMIKVIEVNAGRFFTTSYFFSQAGINMPYYYLRLGMGEKIDKNIKKFNNLEEDLYWVRMIDMGYKLIKGDEWHSLRI